MPDDIADHLLKVMTAEQWLKLAAAIRQVQEDSGYGWVKIEIARTFPRHLSVEVSHEMPAPPKARV